MSESIDPGPGYRLLCDDEIVRDTDERMDGIDPMPSRKWRSAEYETSIDRLTLAAYRKRYSMLDILAVRRRVDSEPSEIDTLREQVAALTADRDDLRQKIADTTERLDERSEKVRLMTDYYISLQRAIKAHCRGQQVEIGPCQYHADLLNADLAMTPERACEIVNQLRQADQLEVRNNTVKWFTPSGPESWQCRPAQPKPVTLTVTCPPSQREAVEAAIRAAGGSV